MRNPETIRESYKLYRKNGGRLDYAIYGEILRRFNLRLRTLLLKNAFLFSMPHGLGYLTIVQFKNKKFDDSGNLIRNNLRVDWGSTIKKYMNVWGTTYTETKHLLKERRDEVKYVYYFNEHSNGYFYSCKWRKINNRIRHKNCFSFELVRSFKMLLTKEIQNKPTYLET